MKVYGCMLPKGMNCLSKPEDKWSCKECVVRTPWEKNCDNCKYDDVESESCLTCNIMYRSDIPVDYFNNFIPKESIVRRLNIKLKKL